jgi:hypothetical protein
MSIIQYYNKSKPYLDLVQRTETAQQSEKKNYSFKLEKNEPYDDDQLVDNDGKIIIFDISDFNTSDETEAENNNFYTKYLENFINNNLEQKKTPFIFFIKTNEHYYLYVYNNKTIQKRPGTSSSHSQLNTNKNYIEIKVNKGEKKDDKYTSTISTLLKHSHDGGHRSYRSHRSHRSHRSYHGQGGNLDLIIPDGDGLYDLYNSTDPSRQPVNTECELMVKYVTTNFDKIKLYLEIESNDKLKAFIEKLKLPSFFDKKLSNI